MGFSGISAWQLLIVLAIVLLLFGTKRLKNIGGDLGSSIKSFKQALSNQQVDTHEAAEQSSHLQTPHKK